MSLVIGAKRVDYFAQEWRIVRWNDAAILLLWLNGGECGGAGADSCTEALVWSDQTCRLHDLPPGHRPSLEEAIGYYRPEARAAIESAVHRAISQGEPWSLELPLVTASGRELWVLAQGQVDLLRWAHAPDVDVRLNHHSLRDHAHLLHSGRQRCGSSSSSRWLGCEWMRASTSRR